jgi:hypothetical protein
MRRKMAARVAVGSLGAASVALAIWFAKIGLDKAAEFATVIAVFVAVIGIVLAFYSVRDSDTQAARADVNPELAGSAGVQSSASAAEPSHDEVHNEIHGGTFRGPVILGRDISTGTFPTDQREPDERDAHS